MSFKTELNQGEIRVVFERPVSGAVTLTEMGLTEDELNFEGGLVRMVFSFERIEENHFYKMPTFEICYTEEMGETHWQCDFNEETILDKFDHHGRSTVVLLNRKKMSAQLNRHVNEFVLHAEFPKGVQLMADKSTVHFFN